MRFAYSAWLARTEEGLDCQGIWELLHKKPTVRLDAVGPVAVDSVTEVFGSPIPRY
jgi:hypothetical protein